MSALLSRGVLGGWKACLMFGLLAFVVHGVSSQSAEPRTFHVDSIGGDDSDSGLSPETPWRGLSKVETTSLLPGDRILFKRGSTFDGCLTLKASGDRERPVVLSDYGDPDQPAPAFTNARFDPKAGQYGNCIRLEGSFITVENLRFQKTVAELSGRIGFLTMWELGAVHIGVGAENCEVRNNEFVDCGVGIKSYGEGAVIRNNVLRDCNRVLKEWNWGPIAIWLGGDQQEVCHNRISNYKVVDPRINWGPNGYGSGADGSAIEIDDARFPKSDISIHHNFTTGNQGFLEVTWSDVQANPPYEGFHIHHNVSDDFQQFIALWRGAGCRIEHNTIIRRKVNENEWGVFNITQNDSRNLIRNNIVVVEQGVVVFNVGKSGRSRPASVIENNLFFAANGPLNMGLEGPGTNPVFADPLFEHYGGGETVEDFSLTSRSPAIGAAWRPEEGRADIGAFEHEGRDKR